MGVRILMKSAKVRRLSLLQILCSRDTLSMCVRWVRSINFDYTSAGTKFAIVSLKPQDGAVEAVVGGYSFNLSQYNRALQAARQVGSNIKPLIYSAAFEQGFTLATLVNDAY